VATSRQLRARKLVCPDDVSIVGHNDMLLVDMVDPPLTTVRISHLEMGEAAARILLRQLDGEKVESEVSRSVSQPTLTVPAHQNFRYVYLVSGWGTR
jgi:LacI family transcriptional regulator